MRDEGYSAVMRAAGLKKVAIRLPVVHGTAGQWENLVRRFGGAISGRLEVNPRSVYVATKNRRTRPGIELFAHRAAQARGGDPSIAHARIDTEEGWIPHGLTEWARNEGLTHEDFIDVIKDLDEGTEEGRGGLWETLQRGVGSWRHADPTATLRPDYYEGLG